MRRCSRCVIPDTRPDTAFVDGVCSACLSYERRAQVDWAARQRDLELLLERGKNSSGYDCIVPSSGGKDSHWQTLKLIELGARPLVVTASTCHLTPMGRANIDNLARYATTVELTPNRETRRQLNKLAMEMVGDISWPEHVSIFTTPFRVAAELGIPLIFYGENPQEAYGGPIGADQARVMTRRWISEFGGFLGLRPADFVQKGFDMREYIAPADAKLSAAKVEAHFLGAYFAWDSARNATLAKAAGMSQRLPTPANWWPHENLDNAQTGIHDVAMYRKYGYGRGAAQVSVDIRRGILKRENALDWVLRFDGWFPEVYAEVLLEDILERLGTNRAWLLTMLERFTRYGLFAREGVMLETDHRLVPQF